MLWQGYLNIKNDTATVHLNLIHGNADVPMEFLPREREATGQASQNRMATLKIVQRMRLEPNQVRVIRPIVIYLFLAGKSCRTNRKELDLLYNGGPSLRYGRARRSLTDRSVAEKVHRVPDREALGRDRQRRRRTKPPYFAHFPTLRVHDKHSPSPGAALPRNGSPPADVARRHRSSMITKVVQ